MGKSKQRKANEKAIDKTARTLDSSRTDLDRAGKRFSNPFEGLQAQQATAQGYEAATAQVGTLGPAQGYDAQGYEAERATAAQADRVNIGEDTGFQNQFANLQVSTAASDRTSAQTDQALATAQEASAITGAGGATAIAQAAKASKADVAAGLSQQEAQNAQLRAQGATDVQRSALQQRNLSRQTDISQNQFNTGLEQQTNLANQQAGNQAAQFGASAQNQAAQFGAAAQNQFSQAQFSADNQFALANQAAQNQSYQFGAAAQNQASQFNANTANQFTQQGAAGQAQLEDRQYAHEANIYSQDAAQAQGAQQRESDRRASNKALVGTIAGGVLGAAGSFLGKPS